MALKPYCCWNTDAQVMLHKSFPKLPTQPLPGVDGGWIVDQECPRHNPGNAESAGQVEHGLPAEVLDDECRCQDGEFWPPSSGMA